MLIKKDKPMTATEIREGWERGCSCGKCEYCYVQKKIETIQNGLLEPLIERVQELMNGRQA